MTIREYWANRRQSSFTNVFMKSAMGDMSVRVFFKSDVCFPYNSGVFFPSHQLQGTGYICFYKYHATVESLESRTYFVSLLFISQHSLPTNPLLLFFVASGDQSLMVGTLYSQSESTSLSWITRGQSSCLRSYKTSRLRGCCFISVINIFISYETMSWNKVTFSNVHLVHSIYEDIFLHVSNFSQG